MTMSRSWAEWVQWTAGAAALLAACSTAPEADLPAGVLEAGGDAVAARDDGDALDPAIAHPAADEGLALTPPMGFNDWNAFGCNVSEELIKQTADFFVESGLKDAGYQYVNIDDCWALRERGADGRIVPDPVKFPSGIAGTADYVHERGLKLGLYGDAGTATCAGYPGSLGFEDIDAQTFAEWGVDYLKYDNCNNNSDGSRADYIRRYTAMGDALRATGRPIVYSVCEWGVVEPWEWASAIGNLWRTTGDINDSWGSLRSIIAQNAPLFWAAGPGAWNDPDMLEIGNGAMSTTEYETHFAMWAMMAAPLLVGTDLRIASDETIRILSNPELIAVDQDPLGVQGQVLYELGGRMVLSKPLVDGDRAVALYNSTDAPAIIAIRAVQTGLPVANAYRMENLWTGVVTQAAETIGASVPAHATTVVRVEPLRRPERIAPSTILGVEVEGGLEGAGPALVVGQDGRLAATFTNQGAGDIRSVALSAEAPDGWTLTAEGDPSADALGTGESLGAGWTVGLPADAVPGSYDLTITATYRWGRSRTPATASSTITARVMAPPPPGLVAVSSLAWVSATNGWGPAE